MSARIRIAVVGDFNPTYEAHTSNSGAMRLAALAIGVNLESAWLPTPSLAGPGAPQVLSTFDGFWLPPGSPYASRVGALAAIRYARENDRPLLGTCGGFQHVLLEYAHHALGLTDLEHGEEHPEAQRLLLTPIACPVTAGDNGEPALSGGVAVRIQPGTRAAALYGASEIQEECFCNYELNPEFRPTLEAGGLRFSAFGDSGEARVVELPGHRFFFATLFQPERSVKSGRAHPVIKAFLEAARNR